MRAFEDIEASKVALANTKLYADLQEGFIGTSLKKDAFICECSDIDDVIVFLRNGQFMVTKVEPKTYVGKDIIHVAVWKRGDKRTTYNMVYRDGTKGASFVKRFHVTGVTRDKLYDLTQGTKGSQVLHFSANPNGEAERLLIHLRALQRLKKLKIDFDFAELAIKGRASKGNTLTKYPIKKIEVKEEGVSTLGARKIWFDTTVQRLNVDGRGQLLGSFKGEDKILEISQSGHYRILGYDLSTHFDEHMILLEKYRPNHPVSVVYYDGEKQKHYVKRFVPEVENRKELFISEHSQSKLEFVSTAHQPRIGVVFRKIKGQQPDDEEVVLSDFISVKGEKAQGNQLSREPIRSIKVLDSLSEQPSKADEELEIAENQVTDSAPEQSKNTHEDKHDDEGQITLEF